MRLHAITLVPRTVLTNTYHLCHGLHTLLQYGKVLNSDLGHIIFTILAVMDIALRIAVVAA
jgi:hypothetical protein